MLFFDKRVRQHRGAQQRSRRVARCGRALCRHLRRSHGACPLSRRICLLRSRRARRAAAQQPLGTLSLSAVTRNGVKSDACAGAAQLVLFCAILSLLRAAAHRAASPALPPRSLRAPARSRCRLAVRCCARMRINAPRACCAPLRSRAADRITLPFACGTCCAHQHRTAMRMLDKHRLFCHRICKISISSSAKYLLRRAFLVTCAIRCGVSQRLASRRGRDVRALRHGASARADANRSGHRHQ